MPKFVARPVVIEAVQFLPETGTLPPGVHECGHPLPGGEKVYRVRDQTGESYALASGEWVIYGPNGQCRTMTAARFATLYTSDIGEDASSGEAPCREHGNYGLCLTHPTCGLVQTMLAELFDALDGAGACIGTVSMRSPLKPEEVVQAGRVHIVLAKCALFRRFWPTPKPDEE